MLIKGILKLQKIERATLSTEKVNTNEFVPKWLVLIRACYSQAIWVNGALYTKKRTDRII